jgi:hypothetical protein
MPNSWCVACGGCLGRAGVSERLELRRSSTGSSRTRWTRLATCLRRFFARPGWWSTLARSAARAGRFMDSRLALNAGIHHLQWSRDKCIAYMMNEAACNEQTSVSEVRALTRLLCAHSAAPHAQVERYFVLAGQV